METRCETYGFSSRSLRENGLMVDPPQERAMHPEPACRASFMVFCEVTQGPTLRRAGAGLDALLSLP